MYALCTHFDIGYYSYHQLAPPKEWETEGFDRVRDDLELIRCYYSAIVILMDDAIYKQREKKAADVQSESVRKQKDENKLLRFQVPTGTTHISIS